MTKHFKKLTKTLKRIAKYSSCLYVISGSWDFKRILTRDFSLGLLPWLEKSYFVEPAHLFIYLEGSQDTPICQVMGQGYFYKWQIEDISQKLKFIFPLQNLPIITTIRKRIFNQCQEAICQIIQGQIFELFIEKTFYWLFISEKISALVWHLNLLLQKQKKGYSRRDCVHWLLMSTTCLKSMINNIYGLFIEC